MNDIKRLEFEKIENVFAEIFKKDDLRIKLDYFGDEDEQYEILFIELLSDKSDLSLFRTSLEVSYEMYNQLYENGCKMNLIHIIDYLNLYMPPEYVMVHYKDNLDKRDIDKLINK